MFRAIILLLTLFTSAYSFVIKSDPQDNFLLLEDRISYDNCRFKTTIYALYLLSKRNAQIIVETGTARNGTANCHGDGCSTIIFGEWASKNNAHLYSVDINIENLLNAAKDLGDSKDFVDLVHSDSVEFLKNFNQNIDFLYLDSYDYEAHNPLPSQQHHLNEIIAAYPWLTEKSVVMIDDCDLPNGGKGKLVIEYLLNKGWKKVLKGYQVILTQ